MKRLRQSGPIGYMAFGVYRFGHMIYTMNNSIVKRILWIIYLIADLIFVKALANAELPADSEIDSTVTFVHNANGCIIGGGAKIGANTTIYHQTTIGVINGNCKGPSIGKNVFVGCGAKILGPVMIGDNAKIGAGAVVLCDIPEGETAVGVPAKIIDKKLFECGIKS